ncbi:MAG: histidine phosphatase family protein [Oscillospiraceae bacterium]|nr:histidine phosphatase family protein [Oscillospiraceae bacterium]
MKVWMIRHGESEANKLGVWSGWQDARLTEKGREEAARVGATLSRVKFDKIYASDLSRAQNTASIAIPSCTYETTPLLREISVGSLVGKSPASIQNAKDLLALCSGYEKFGGESKEQFRERVASFQEILETQNCENVAVFTHMGVIKSFLNLVSALRSPGKNCALKIVWLQFLSIAIPHGDCITG